MDRAFGKQAPTVNKSKRPLFQNLVPSTGANCTSLESDPISPTSHHATRDLLLLKR